MASSASLGPCSLSHSQRSEQRWPCPHSACPAQLPPISSRLVAWERQGGTHTCTHTHTPHTAQSQSPRSQLPLPVPYLPEPETERRIQCDVTAGKPLPRAFSLSLEGWGLPGRSELSSHLLPHTRPPAWTGTDHSLSGGGDSCSGTCSALSGHRSRGWWGMDPNPGQH